MINKFWRAVGLSGVPFAESILSRAGILKGTGDVEFVIPWRGIRYHGNLRHLIDRYIYFLGSYAPAELEFLQRAAGMLRRQRDIVTMLDIGANVGQHSLALYREVGRVIAFEPNLEVTARLKTNLRANNIKNVEVHEIALGDLDGTALLGSGLPGNDGSRSLEWSSSGGNTTEVPVRHAGNYLKTIAPPLTRIDLIKLDVEGYEKVVLGALRSELRRDRPIILFELVGCQIKGGFGSEEELKGALYENHALFGLRHSHHAQLENFVWSEHEEAVCIPMEQVPALQNLIA